MASTSATATAALALLAVGLAAAPLRGAHAVSLVHGPVDAAVPSDIAYPGQFPWHAAVHKAGEDANSLLGSGALVSQKFVLTAASIIPSDLTGLEVVLGVISLRQAGLKVAVEGVKKHDLWTADSPAANDLALLQLATNVILPNDNSIALVALPPWYYRGATYKDLSVTVSSWGANSPDYKGMFLREVVADVLSNRECENSRGGVRTQAAQLCALQALDDMDVRLGGFDGGDPAVFTEPSGVRRLVGIVSPERQAASGTPTVMARITEHLAWIAANSDAVIGG